MPCLEVLRLSDVNIMVNDRHAHSRFYTKAAPGLTSALLMTPDTFQALYLRGRSNHGDEDSMNPALNR
jgi:hypothetical protein